METLMFTDAQKRWADDQLHVGSLEWMHYHELCKQAGLTLAEYLELKPSRVREWMLIRTMQDSEKLLQVCRSRHRFLYISGEILDPSDEVVATLPVKPWFPTELRGE